MVGLCSRQLCLVSVHPKILCAFRCVSVETLSNKLRLGIPIIFLAKQVNFKSLFLMVTVSI